MLVHGEEVVASQVGVPIGVAGVDRLGLQGEPAAGAGGLLGIDLEAPLEVVEGAPHLGHHGVPGHEPEAAVRRIDRIGAGQLVARHRGHGGGFGGHCLPPRGSVPSG